VLWENGDYLSSRFPDPQFFLVYADRRLFEVGGKFLLKAISASSRNLLLRDGSPGPHSQPIFGGGDFKLCDGAIHRPFFGEERSPFLAFLKPCDDMAQDWIVAGRVWLYGLYQFCWAEVVSYRA